MKKQSNTSLIMWHKHHILPKHAGGTDDPSNIVKVNVAMHAMLHKIRYEETGDTWDKVAYLCLSKSVGKDEATRLLLSEAGKIGGKMKTPNPWNKGLSTGPWGNTKEQRERSSKRATARNKKLNSTYYDCPHCGRNIGGLANFRRYHGDNCKERQ